MDKNFKDWVVQMSEDSAPLVSVCCITFNQEKYITAALQSFVVQKTSFKFEVLIYDDASTDSTPDLIKDFCKKYPDLFFPIFSKENQFGKGVKVNFVNNINRAKGEYIALCEGDDFWIGEDKLEKQVRALMMFPEVNIAFHQAREVSDNKLGSVCLKDIPPKQHILTREAILRGGGPAMPTPSIMIRAEVLKAMPDWFYTTAPVGDLYIQAIGAAPNGALFVPDLEAGYRVLTPGSWTRKQLTQDRNSIIDVLMRNEKCLKALDEFDFDRKSIALAIGLEYLHAASKAGRNGYLDLAITYYVKSKRLRPTLGTRDFKFFITLCYGSLKGLAQSSG